MKSGPERRAAKDGILFTRPELPDVAQGHAPVEFNGGLVGPAGLPLAVHTPIVKKGRPESWHNPTCAPAR